MPNVIDKRGAAAPTKRTVDESTTPSEESEELSPEAALLSRLARWLMAQPEYPIIFLNDRTTRRQFARKAASIISTIPKVRVK